MADEFGAMEAKEPQAAEKMEGERLSSEEGGEAASPEEQKLYEEFTSGVMAIVYPENAKGEVSPQILDDLRGNIDPKILQIYEQAQPPVSKQPADIVAVVAVTLLIIVDQQKGYGAKIAEGGEGPDFTAVLMQAGTTILEELIEVAEAAKIHEFSEEEIEAATYRAMDLYRTAAETMGLPGYDKQGLTGAFNELVAADKAGNLDKVLPGLPGGKPMEAS